MAGRGFGKTRAGAEWVRQRVMSGQSKSLALIAQTPTDARAIMIHGPSGLLNVGPPDERPKYEPSKLLLEWPNGAIGHIRSGAHPEKVRGLEVDTIWADELAAWEYPQQSWELIEMAMRVGDPRAIVTTTPKPLLFLKQLINQQSTVVTRGSTFDNRDNLSDKFFRDITSKYEGTSLGQQELYAVLLEEAEGALWTRDMLSTTRVAACPDAMVRTVVAVDPAISKGAESAETGIVVVSRSKDGEGYVRADRSGKYSPAAWAKRVVQAFDEFSADRVVVETNQGGDMVRHVLQSERLNLPIKEVKATDGKRTRAEPIAALYEQNRIHHVGVHEILEDQLATWVPDTGDPSPDRLDALVWACTELLHTAHIPQVSPWGVEQRNPWVIA